MEIIDRRRYRGTEYTIGDLIVNGKKFCDTLEDPDRGLTSDMTNAEIIKTKVYGKTAIPKGKYKIEMGVVSPKFRSRAWAVRWGGKLPRLLNVPGFDGVLIHPLNTAEETLGCIGVGENKVKGKIINSVETFNRLMPLLIEAYYRGESITLTVE